MQDATVLIPNRGENGAEFARRLFLDDPSLSIDDAEKSLNRFHLGVSKHEVSRIRLEVRQRIMSAQERPPEPLVGPGVRRRLPGERPMSTITGPKLVTRAPEPFNPPRIVFKVVKPAPEPVRNQPPAPEPVIAVKQEASVPNNPEKEPSAVEKRNWLESWMLDNPQATVSAAREALRSHFKTTMNTTTIAEVVRLTHEAAGLPSRIGRPPLLRKEPEPRPAPQPPEPEPVASQIADLAHRMRALGVRRIEVVGKHFRVTLDDDE